MFLILKGEIYLRPVFDRNQFLQFSPHRFGSSDFVGCNFIISRPLSVTVYLFIESVLTHRHVQAICTFYIQIDNSQDQFACKVAQRNRRHRFLILSIGLVWVVWRRVYCCNAFYQHAISFRVYICVFTLFTFVNINIFNFGCTRLTSYSLARVYTYTYKYKDSHGCTHPKRTDKMYTKQFKFQKTKFFKNQLVLSLHLSYDFINLTHTFQLLIFISTVSLYFKTFSKNA